MQSLHMITVVKTDVASLSGGGFNTIRKFKGKYLRLHVGDKVTMHHTDDPQTQGAAHLTEMLEVASLAIGPLDTLIDAHGFRNHEMGIGVDGLDGLKDHILSFYPLAEGEERDPNELFVAIYF